MELLLFAALAAAAAISLGFWEVPLPAPAFQHHVVELPGDKIPGKARILEPNTVLRDRAVKLFEDSIFGTESVAPGPGPSCITMLDRQGHLWLADASPEDGGSGGYRLRSESSAYLGPGRPLGFKYDAEGNLLLCDSLLGLVMLEGASGLGVQAAAAEPQGSGDQGSSAGPGAFREHAEGAPKLSHTVLANRVSPSSPLDPGTHIAYANDLDISPVDGTVFFSDSQAIPVALGPNGFFDTFRSWMLGLFAGAASGRLLAYFPTNGTTHVLAKDFWYANGVAVSADGSFVVVAETNCFKVHRYWLEGPKAGTTDTLIDNLPGFPDGVSRSSTGDFWIAIVAPRSPIVPYLRYKLVRAIGAWLPAALRPRPSAQGLLLKVSPSGQLLGSYWDPKGEQVAMISSVEEHDGQLWLGQLAGSGVGFMDLSEEIGSS